MPARQLHSHPQDETFYVLEGNVTVWIVEDAELAANRSSPPTWQRTHAQPCGVGAAAFVPADVPHTFRESDTARMLFLSTPAGIKDYVQALAEPARWPWLQPPSGGPRVSAERLEAVERELGVIRHGSPRRPASDRRASCTKASAVCP